MPSNPLASRLGVSDRVHRAGVAPQAELRWWYSAADVLTLCSSREGWANVLLEAMACGTPVIATDIWGTSEVVSSEAAGRLMERRDARALADAWHDLMSAMPARAATPDNTPKGSPGMPRPRANYNCSRVLSAAPRHPLSRSSALAWAVATILVVLTVGLLFLQAPHGGAFYWSEAPRHALNGVFVMDLLRDLPLDDPAGYALPLLRAVPRPDHPVLPAAVLHSQCAVWCHWGLARGGLAGGALHYIACGVGGWRLARFWLDTQGALAFSLLMLVLPEVAFWGRQVMLEVPAFAFVVWSAVAFMMHWRENRRAGLYWAAALLVLGMYTKISVGYVSLVYVVMLAWRHH